MGWLLPFRLRCSRFAEHNCELLPKVGPLGMLVRLRGVLTAVEQHLTTTRPVTVKKLLCAPIFGLVVMFMGPPLV